MAREHQWDAADPKRHQHFEERLKQANKDQLREWFANPLQYCRSRPDAHYISGYVEIGIHLDANGEPCRIVSNILDGGWIDYPTEPHRTSTHSFDHFKSYEDLKQELLNPEVKR